MADKIKSCRCGSRIPDTWLECYQCEALPEKDLQTASDIRTERYMLVRVRRTLDYEILDLVGADLRDKLEDCVVKRARERHLLEMRDALTTGAAVHHKMWYLVEQYQRHNPPPAATMVVAPTTKQQQGPKRTRTRKRQVATFLCGECWTQRPTSQQARPKVCADCTER